MANFSDKHIRLTQHGVKLCGAMAYMIADVNLAGQVVCHSSAVCLRSVSKTDEAKRIVYSLTTTESRIPTRRLLPRGAICRL